MVRRGTDLLVSGSFADDCICSGLVPHGCNGSHPIFKLNVDFVVATHWRFHVCSVFGVSVARLSWGSPWAM